MLCPETILGRIGLYRDVACMLGRYLQADQHGEGDYEKRQRQRTRTLLVLVVSQFEFFDA